MIRMEKKEIIIRHPTINELNEVSSLLYIGFYDKFSFVFKENTKIGEIIFKNFFLTVYNEQALKRIIVAVQNHRVIGTIEIHTKSKKGPIFKLISLFFLLWKYYGFFKAVKKIFVISFMNIEKVEKKSAYITSFAVKPDLRNQSIGKKLLLASEKLAKQRKCIYLTLHVLFRNRKARNLYVKYGFKIEKYQKSSLLKYFMGANGATYMKKRI